MHSNNIFSSPQYDNKNSSMNNARSPSKPQNQSSSKHSYANDYHRFLEKQDQLSETKSQASQNSNNDNKNYQYQNGHNYNKSCSHTNNKQVQQNVSFQPQSNDYNKNTVKVPQSILKQESVNENQKTIQEQKRYPPNQGQQNGFDDNNSHNRRQSYQQQQRPQYQQEQGQKQYNNNGHNQNYQNDSASVSSANSSKHKQQCSTHQQHYQNQIKSPPSETGNFKKDHTDYQVERRQNERQPNVCDDDNKSVSSQASHISQLVCSNCINKDLMLERQLRNQQNREKQIQLERNAIDADKDNLYNSCMNQHEQTKNSQNKFARDIQEQINQKNDMKREEHEREVNQRLANQIKLQEEQEKALQKRIEDVKNQRNMLKKDIEAQQQSKQQKLQKEKEQDRKLQDMLAAQREHDVHNQMAQIAEKKNQTQEIRDGLLSQFEEKKRKQEEKAQEVADQRRQLEKQLQIDMEMRDRKLQEKADEIKKYQDHWTLQQQAKEKQKMDQRRENEKFKEGQDAILENDRQIYFNNIERDEQVKRAAARGLLDQISSKKDQKEREHEQKLLQGQKLREQQARDLELARLNYHDCDRCHATFPTNNLTKQRTYKSKNKY